VTVPNVHDYQAPPKDDTSANSSKPNDQNEDTWAPIDPTPYLEGTIVREPPSLGLARTDKVMTLYPGKEHAVIGEMEGGKSWFALACCKEEIENGRRVVYIHFEEADPSDTYERLILLGVAKQNIIDRFVFVGPDTPVTTKKLKRLLTPAPALVVFDGVNEAMSLHGQKIREEDGAAQFRRLLVKPCTKVGAATLACDHVVKDKERRGRDAIGTVHKSNGLTGVQFLLETVEPFGRGLRGRSHCFIVKDRPGHLRRQGRAGAIPGKTFFGEFIVDDTRKDFSYLDLKLWAPNEKTEEVIEVTFTDEDILLTVVREIIVNGYPPNGKRIRAASSFGDHKTDELVARLEMSGKLRRLSQAECKSKWPTEKVPSNAHVYVPTSAPTSAEDQQEDDQ
jgi:hypothetical protein